MNFLVSSLDIYTRKAYTQVVDEVKAATVVSTKDFDKKIAKLLTEEERELLDFELATRPSAYPVVPGLAGVRKARWGVEGPAKARGYAVIYFYASEEGEVLEVFVFAKNEKENVSNDDRQKIIREVEGYKNDRKRQT